jgi:acyl-CoA synthetase (NDP forming)
MESKTGTVALDKSFWEAVFTPRSVVIVGKTERSKGGYTYIKALQNFHFQGNVYVISTDGKGEHVFESVASFEDLPTGIDYAILALQAKQVPDTIRKLKGKGIRVAHIFSSGFGDLETEVGRRLEEDMMRASRESGIRIIGPNCLGVLSPRGGLAYSPGIFPESRGNVGFISQSGGTAQSFAWCGENYHYFHSKGVSIGNSSDLSVEDFLEYMADDPETEIIALYVEGIRDGARFVRLIRRASVKKPVIILKAGLSDAGVIAVSSHTGIMAGEARIWEAAIRQGGGIRVESFDEMVETTSAFTKMKGNPGRRIALVNRGGGEGVIAADLISNSGLEVPPYSEATQRALSDLIPSAGTGFKNPVDFAGVGGYPGNFEKIFEIIDNDKNTDTIIYQHHIEFAHLFSRSKKYSDYLLDALISFHKKAQKTFLIALPLYYSSEFWLQAFKRLTSEGISTHPTVSGAMKAALHLAEYNEMRKGLQSNVE